MDARNSGKLLRVRKTLAVHPRLNHEGRVLITQRTEVDWLTTQTTLLTAASSRT